MHQGGRRWFPCLTSRSHFQAVAKEFLVIGVCVTDSLRKCEADWQTGDTYEQTG